MQFNLRELLETRGSPVTIEDGGTEMQNEIEGPSRVISSPVSNDDARYLMTRAENVM